MKIQSFSWPCSLFDLVGCLIRYSFYFIEYHHRQRNYCWRMSNCLHRYSFKHPLRLTLFSTFAIVALKSSLVSRPNCLDVESFCDELCGCCDDCANQFLTSRLNCCSFWNAFARTCSSPSELKTHTLYLARQHSFSFTYSSKGHQSCASLASEACFWSPKVLSVFGYPSLSNTHTYVQLYRLQPWIHSRQSRNQAN